ncbi:MAG TPA: ATP-binding protein [Saprospiraceae bacterium]|nr:ATP-binding protein [Saprospiraceae bacterium]HMU02668.1 ATP-binding protein [Saprospiraceae bacterium]
MIKRTLFEAIKAKIDFKKAIILLGPRQVGKTFLIQKITEEIRLPFLMINGDNPADRLLWTNPDFQLIQSLIAPYQLIVFDEAQRIENIGLTVKMIVDAKFDKQVIITGSSALGLGDTIQEPLTGRKWEFTMFPVAWSELKDTYTLAKSLPMLEQLLVFGSYPEIILREEKEELLSTLSGSYLYKDILELGGIRKPEVLVRLLQALAWQVGSEVSYNEISKTVGIDRATVESYINLLEKSFVVYRLNPLSRNERKEISTSRKIYFYDNGIRNAIINNFNPIGQRNDVGALWENYFITEKLKSNSYQKLSVKSWFWRSKMHAEIDYIEEGKDGFTAFELKWNEKKNARFSTTFTDFYKPKETSIINRSNFWKHL